MEKIDICNRALLLINRKFINSLDDNSIEATYCNFIYNATKKYVLSAYPWKCLLKKITLYANGKNKQSYDDYDYMYVLPMDIIRVVYVNDSKDYKRVGNTLFCNHNNISLEYIANITEDKIEDYILNLISIKLAIDLSVSLGSDLSMHNYLKKIYDDEFKQASKMDSHNGRPVINLDDYNSQSNIWLNSR